MSLIFGLINTPNLDFCLSSSKTQFQQFKKDVLNTATQDWIMNVHNYTHISYENTNCLLNDSSCNTLIPKILELALLVSSASSSSKITFKFTHTKDDSILTYKFVINLKFKNYMQH